MEKPSLFIGQSIVYDGFANNYFKWRRKQTPSGNILQLINELNLQIDHIIVEVNNAIIPSQDIPTTMLKNNDKVEIIRYIGGGT